MNCARSTGAIGFEAISALIFGAAWKVLDLLIEWRLVQLGIHESKKKPLHYTIEFKTKAIGKGDLKPMAPFDAQPDLWERIAETYAATANLRRSLVHRRILEDAPPGPVRLSVSQPPDWSRWM
ncbi:hypothetical protein OG874_11325 [Nocardia sp. NBC_00565]|uniref:hypothetical protein n=1 Tax=Nocardia sp. NBC_00565 TaxID=2975993 RepID=UPI002E7FC872|nr:hypothetical protein [Nocardia sp. NBC_00565]WUC05688.1 hypothetical protein OG874_11325 [Nocardia sp. NBC_00565]